MKRAPRKQSNTLISRLNQAVIYIRSKCKLEPKIGIILGTGLGSLAQEINKATVIPYSKIPYFPISTVPTHKGELILGNLSGQKVVAMDGRFHYYEGYSLEQITLPIRVMKAIGIYYLIISCAAGSMNPNYGLGDLVLIQDHINLMGVNPLIGPNDERLGPRFPDMSEPYDLALIKQAERIAQNHQIKTHRGVYVAMTGPNLETRAEYRMLRIIGADVVGMSMVPEVIVGVHAGLKILGIAVVTDLCTPETIKPVKIEEIIQIANQASPKMITIIKELISTL